MLTLRALRRVWGSGVERKPLQRRLPAPVPAPCTTRLEGPVGEGGFRPSGPSPRPRGSSEKTQRDRSSIETNSP